MPGIIAATSPFSAALKNDLTDTPAYHHGVLLEIVLFAYSRDIINAHCIETACRGHVVLAQASLA